MVAPDDLPVFIHQPDTIRIAVECYSQLGLFLPHRRDDVLEVLRYRWIGVVVRERSVAFAEQDSRRDADPVEQWLCDERSSAVPAIDHALDLTRKLADPLAYVLDVVVEHIVMPKLSLALGKFSADSDLIDLLYVGSVDGPGLHSELEPVELRRVVRPGDLYSACNAKLVLGPVGQWSRYDPDIDDVQSTFEEAGDELRV